MADLKAAAKIMRAEAESASTEVELYPSGSWGDKCKQERDAFALAAQALEAWEWQRERNATVQPYNGGWLCGTIDNSGHADTPLGAVLAAMEGERDGK